ncbi:hypothetical protein BYT27DRAFT_7214091 [Phlegmacium glaucopus]|nr:hypothetical protein BYT27DRAFT_7214091 [Phlegmacium glaucopus]
MTTAPEIVEASCQSSWERLRAAAISEGIKFSKTEIRPTSLLGVYYSVWASIWDSDTMPEDFDYGERFKGLTRGKDSKENLWLVNDVTWPVDDDDRKEPYSVDAHDEAEEKKRTRATNDFGLACLVTLDSARKPFLEMLYNTGEAKDPIRRLVRDGAADISETRDNEDVEDEDEDDEDEDAEGDLNEEL